MLWSGGLPSSRRLRRGLMHKFAFVEARCAMYIHLRGLMCNSQCAMCNAERHLYMRLVVLSTIIREVRCAIYGRECHPP